MSYEREFPASAIATVVYIASGIANLIAATNPARAQLSLQGADSFFFGPQPSVTGSAGLLVGSGAIVSERFHVGPVYGNSAAVNGATIAIRVWEAGY